MLDRIVRGRDFRGPGGPHAAKTVAGALQPAARRPASRGDRRGRRGGGRPIDQAEFIAHLRGGIESHSRNAYVAEAWDRLASSISYCVPDPSGYERLAEHLERVEERGICGNRLYYLATPPSAFPGIIEALGRAGLNRPGKNGSWARIVLEKPIGHDSASAAALNGVVNDVFDEKHVYRIDHYLGKETVQNLLVFRFANAIFEPLWNQKYVDNVQITVAESIGVGTRGKYYEEAGTTRDMVQNHMLQLLCLTAMEPPVSLRSEFDSRREGQDPAGAETGSAGGCRTSDGPRTVRTRPGRRRAGGRLQGGRGRLRGLANGDLRRGATARG